MRQQTLRLLRGMKKFWRHTRRMVGVALMPGDAISPQFEQWLEEGEMLLSRMAGTLNQDLNRSLVAVPADDWSRRLGCIREKQAQITRRTSPCLEKLRALGALAEQFREGIGKQYFENLQRAADQSVKVRIRSLADRDLQKIALRQFVLWKDAEIVEAIRAAAVRWDVSLERRAEVGRGMDSRIVEMPLAFEQGDLYREGKVLDAGCALNHPYCRELLRQSPVKLLHFTQSAEDEPPLFEADRYSYVLGDLRRMDFRDETFDHVLCISTLEHVGMDNTRYFKDRGKESRSESYLEALKEMLRVLRRGGKLLVTFPYGAYEDRGWYQVFSQKEIDQMLGVLAPHRCDVKYYYSDGIWFEGPGELAKNWTESGIEDAVAVIRVCKG